MTLEPNELLKLFLQDHQVLVRGLTAIKAALDAGDDEQARELADQLDAEVGAHIEFEERVFYPLLVKTLGAERVRVFLAEHASGLDAIRALRQEVLPAEPAARGQLVAQLDTMLEHTYGCGSLSSHLETLDEPQQAELRTELLAARERAKRWTEVRE